MKKIFPPLFLYILACTFAQAATITVNDATDGSVPDACTLRDAIASVNNGRSYSGGCESHAAGDLGDNDTIVFAPHLPTGTIPVTSAGGGEIIITADLTIIGPLKDGGTPDITLDANPDEDAPGGNRIFNVTGGANLSITGVKFAHGNADKGGAVYAGNNVAISNSTFSNNSASLSNGGSYGGAVYAGNNVAISNSTFSNNSASLSNGGSYGGAVYAGNNVAISNSTFSNNSASPSNGDSRGGAVYVSNTATISNSTFSNNSASTPNGGSYGGAVYVSNTTTTATISSSTFSNNSASTSNGDSRGGAVLANKLNARHLTFLNNTTDHKGQAVYVYSSSTLHNSIVIGDNGKPQCSDDTLTGSYNLEGHHNNGTWQASGTSCGKNEPVAVTGKPALNTIIETTLADNGGPTPTFALPTGSPAIGKADPTSDGTSQMLNAAGAWVDATLDQRGYERVAVAYRRDVGAYESNTLRFVPAILPDGQVGVAYTDTPVGTVISGMKPFIFTWTGGTLPTDMNLKDNGILAGTPTADGDYDFDITVTDDDLRSVTHTLTLRVRPYEPPPPADGATPIPALPAPLLLALIALLALMGAAVVRQRGRRP